MALEWLWYIVIGGLAGWLASVLVRGRGLGLVGDILVGIVGGLLGGLMFGWLVPANGFVGSFVTALLGAVVLLFLVKLIKKI